MSQIQIGLSAIRAAQAAIATTANNISNASTEGYHRQRVDLASAPIRNVGGLLIGGGVTVDRVSRIRDAFVEQTLTSHISGQAATGASLSVAERIERAFTPGTGSLHEVVSNYFDQIDQLSTRPDESVLREQVIASGVAIAASIKEMTSALNAVEKSIKSDLSQSVETVNNLAEKIANTNREIRVERARGVEPNSLLDQRDKLINSLAEYVDIDIQSVINGGDPLVAAGGTLVIGAVASKLSLETLDSGELRLTSSIGHTGNFVRSGRIGGLFESLHELNLGVRANFDEWATSLVQGIDTIHATGLGLDGPASSLTGTRGGIDVDATLESAGTLFPLESGTLSLTITDQSNQRRTYQIPVDVTVDSLRDVASRIDALTGVSTVIDQAAGTLSLQADQQYKIDFAGRPDQTPTTQAITGTASPTISGTYLGTTNTSWNAQVVSGGQVGVTSPMLLRITDVQTGQIVREMDIGRGFPANQPIEISNGISIQLTTGSLNAGDTFSVNLVKNPDQTGLLASLGIGSFFSGNSLDSLSVNSKVLGNPNQFASSRSGRVGDGAQLNAFSNLREQSLFSSGTETLEERLATLTSLSGVSVLTKQQQAEQFELQKLELETARDSVSGVDPNEELLAMLEYQRAFEVAAKFVSSMNETLDQLLTLVR